MLELDAPGYALRDGQLLVGPRLAPKVGGAKLGA